MPEGEGQKPKAGINLNLGTQIDAALGDVIRGLLKKPAEEAGNLLADGIGLLGDRVRRKRLVNAQLGLEDTRAILEGRDVQLKDITPPSEEDLQIVLDGMSLTPDDRVRKMWAGLLASALDPNAAQSVERPITSAIASLSPSDARVIEYVAFVSESNRSIQLDAKRLAGVTDKSWMTVGEANRIEEARLSMSTRLVTYMDTAARMEAEFELSQVTAAADWPDNLIRLGVIRPNMIDYRPGTKTPSIRGLDIKGEFISEMMEFIENRIAEAEGLVLEGLVVEYLYKRDEKNMRIRLGVELTRFGEKLCHACGLI